MTEPIPMDISQNHSFTLMYQVVNDSTQRQNHKLIDNSGYSYTVKRKTGIVLPLSNVVVFSLFDINPSVIQLTTVLLSAKVIAAVKTKATENIFRPAAEIVDEVVLPANQQEPGLPLKSGTYLYFWQSYGKKAGSMPANLNFVHKKLLKGDKVPPLSHERILEQFQTLKNQTLKNQGKHFLWRRLLYYVQKTWFESSVWSPSQCSIFMQSIPTNNYVEGWHRRLKGHARRGQLQFYLLASQGITACDCPSRVCALKWAATLSPFHIQKVTSQSIHFVG